MNYESVIKNFQGKEIYIFGTGIDAEKLTKRIKNYVVVRAYIDNKRSGKNILFEGRKVISLEQCRESGKCPIVVAAIRYCVEIAKQLEAAGFIPEKDFWILDENGLWSADQNTKSYIAFLENLWMRVRENQSEAKILIPFDSRHDLISLIYSYCANYFASVYDAEICAYLRFGAAAENASPVVASIYKAFHANTLIDAKLTPEQKEEADEITEQLWEKLNSWEDWQKIYIYGIHFGTTMIRDFLRRQIPTFCLRDQKMRDFLYESVKTIVFWHGYFDRNDVKIVLLADGVSWDGYIRDLAVAKGIPAYALCYKMVRAFPDFCDRSAYWYFDEIWEQLSEKEKQYGIKWAEEHIARRIMGSAEEVYINNKSNFTFAEKFKKSRVLEENDKLKVVICPHIFEEDSYWCGEQIFDDNYFSWLTHLGELAEITPEYDWYLKMHPFAQRRDFMIIDMLLERFPMIKRIPSDVSPLQMKEEGVEFALTVYGTIGHEYPEIGIQVINAGRNPHSRFDFTWNPETKEEYDQIILNLERLKKKKDREGLCRFYSLNYLYYDWDYVPFKTLFFENPYLAMDKLELEACGKAMGSWIYKEYIQEWTEERHEKIWNSLEGIFKRLDEWKPNVLYKKEGIEIG